MHLHFERNTNSKCDCAVLSLTWMGKVPDELPEDEGWKLNRTHYYQEGWLATGNVRGIVGVTFTTSHCKKAVDFPLRTNYNLRGHRSEVILVKWNEPYQKLASCDSSGIIFVWIKYEGRWSIELINDRNTPVTHFSWSHDGRMALICYQDGFVLVGSVAGQRYWSSMLNIDSVITCGIWTPDDQQVYISTTGGQVIVMDVHGAMVSQVQLSSDVAITAMAWSCEKFKMEEGDDADVTQPDDRALVLAVGFQNGYVYLMKSFDDVSPVQVHTGMCGGLRLEWSNSRELLAVAGSSQHHSPHPHVEYTNLLKFYSDTGVLLYSALIPYTQSPVTALTWGHNDKRLFVATGCQVHIAWVSRRIASLQLLCRLRVHHALRSESQLAVLPLPPRLKALIANLFAQTIRCCVPEVCGLREFVSRPPAGSVRLHCTMIRHDEETNMSSGSCYTLYLEYLGGLVPLLKGKRTSKIRPEFVIFDPQVDELAAAAVDLTDSAKSSGSSQNAASDTSDTEREDGCGSPRVQRRRRRRHRAAQPGDRAPAAGPAGAAAAAPGDKAPPAADAELQDDLAYVDTLPEHIRLVEVTSNIWGTKFKIHGLATCVPANLGQVTYKTSLLHLQPRQMTLVMTELRDDVPPDPDPTFNPNLFSEDEEELVGGRDGSISDVAPPIAPMTPAGRYGAGCQPRPESTTAVREPPVPALARAESYEDEFPYVDLTDVANLCESLKQAQALSKGYVESSCCTCPPVGIYGMGRSSNVSQGQPQPSRHAVSPLMCEGSVPALQSPKNTVAPSDVLIERAAPSQAGGDVQRVKTVLTEQATQCAVKLNLNLNLEERRPLVVKRVGDLEAVGSRTLYHAGCPGELGDPQKCAAASMNALNKRRDKHCGKPSPSGNQVGVAGRCPGKPEDMKYIDEDARTEPPTPDRVGAARRIPAVVPRSPACLAESMVRSCSVGYLDLVDAQLVPCEVALMMLRKDTPKRLVLVNRKKQRRKNKPDKGQGAKQPRLKQCGKSRSLDSSDIFPVPCSSGTGPGQLPATSEQETEVAPAAPEAGEPAPGPAVSAATPRRGACNNNYDSSETDCECPVDVVVPGLGEPCRDEATQLGAPKGSAVANGLSALDCLSSRRKDQDDTRSLPSPSPRPSPRLPRSSPASPAPSKKASKRNQSSSPIRKHLLNSPLLSRRQRKNKTTESSDDEVVHSSDEVFNGKNYRDLESFQKAQLRQKLKRGKCKLDGPEGSPLLVFASPRRREFVMHNKAPMWNENSQVYQLDFGGRVTQESAKNFQIEFRGKQVMQFGRIDGNAYTLDFQYPFSALQAFAVALANVTQRLK